MIGGKVVEYGEADAYGHRKLGGIGQIMGEALKKMTGENIIYQQLCLPHALRRARRAGPDGGRQLRQHGDPVDHRAARAGAWSRCATAPTPTSP